MGYFQPNTLWRDGQYYLDAASGEYMPKYVLILATSLNGDDALSAVLTSKSNGLRRDPPCDHGPPRAGYFIGVPGGGLTLPTWVDFSSVDDQDSFAFERRVVAGRVSKAALTLPPPLFCQVLRCLTQSDDLVKRQHAWLAQTIQSLNCP